MLLVAMKELRGSEFRRPVLKTRVQSENWIRATVSGPRADLVPKAGSRSGLCLEEGCTELIAYERKWGFVIATTDCSIAGIWILLYFSVTWPSFCMVQMRRSHR